MTLLLRSRARAGAWLRRPACLAVTALSVAAACADRASLLPEAQAPDGPSPLRLECTADLRRATLTCADPSQGARRTVFGGQDTYVRLASTNVAYDSVTEVFRADVTVQNLLQQAMGTADGVSAHAEGVRVFFHAAPQVTGGAGLAEVANADGLGTFTAAGQAYFQYPGLLARQAVSAPKTWRWSVSKTATGFTFGVYVSAALEPRVVITEIMPNPGAVDDASGEWFELYNPGLDSVNLAGWRIVSRSGSSTESHTIAGDLKIAPRGYAVLIADSAYAFNGGIVEAYAFGQGVLALSNSTSATAPDYLALRRPAALGTHPAVDSVVWAVGGATTAPPTARSRELLDVTADNVNLAGAAWNTAYREYGVGSDGSFDRGTPGAANSPFVPVGAVATVRLSPAFFAVDTVGQFRRFAAVGSDTLGQVSATTFTWWSSDTTVATIDAAGLVRQKAQGITEIVGTAANGVADTVAYGVFPFSPAPVYGNHVEFGTPVDGNASDDIVLAKAQYHVSYNAARGGPNWVSWQLNRTHFGAAPRASTFLADSTLPAGTYLVTHGDYTNSGYSRGHMVMSEQRTQTAADNLTTFRTTNVWPQYQDMNGGPWLDFEEFANNQVRFAGKDVYAVAGAAFAYPGAVPTIKNEGKIWIPSHTWKIVVVVPAGRTLAGVTSAADLEVFAVRMPNVTGIISHPWTRYTVSVDALEAETGYDFLAALPDAVEAAVEAAVAP
jgi:DNA/RNA endonuclease G (NUC1)